MEDIKHGDKTITLKVRFWANQLDSEKVAWDSGVVHAVTNRSRGIRNDENPIPFNNLNDVTKAIKKCLIKHRINLVDNKRKLLDLDD